MPQPLVVAGPPKKELLSCGFPYAVVLYPLSTNPLFEHDSLKIKVIKVLRVYANISWYKNHTEAFLNKKQIKINKSVKVFVHKN